ncbi:MAG: polysaccharide biosynthesis protein [Clostridiales bacterium]|nr:polysaccharide biosynthesis protein [Clostridiales bacterium]
MKFKPNKKQSFYGIRQLALMIVDIFCLLGSYFLCVLFFPTAILGATFAFSTVAWNFALFAVCLLASDICFGIYSGIWRYAAFGSYLKLVFAHFVGGVLALIIAWFLKISIGVWQSLAIVSIATLASVTLRFIYQYAYQQKNHRQQKNYTYVAIVGAGNLGTMLARELLYNKNSKYRPYCFIDIDKRKIGSRIYGIKILNGNDEKICGIIKKAPVKDIILAFSDRNQQKIEKLYAFYSQTGLNIKVYDYPFLDEGKDISGKRILREIRIEDLLFRAPIIMQEKDIEDYYSGKTVLVTGGGGSIGSELCRQIAIKKPKKLIILDIYENNAYDIQQELLMKYGKALDFSVEIASVRDREKTETVFNQYRPDIVFHAAAHKHVPLMENSPDEAIKNNCLGTFNTADMAEKYGAEKFILISTDKAVNPTNVMGATKRFCEMIVQSRFDSSTSFAAVRFGNVLGSNGSVVPLFKKQIEKGGPITITDKRIIRYFMTISEACQLVLHAGMQAERGELFVLDMGKPVKILDLAENMIRLSGLEPYKDIQIKEIGLRQGEKLYEELLVKTDKTETTTHDMIFIEKEIPPTREEVLDKLKYLTDTIDKDGVDTEKIKSALKIAVPTFREPEEINKNVRTCETR